MYVKRGKLMQITWEKEWMSYMYLIFGVHCDHLLLTSVVCVVLLHELLLVHKISKEAGMVENNVCGNSESTTTQ